MNALVREARLSDKAPLMHFIRRLWGGHDYIPRVWDHWMQENGAKTFVVEVDGSAVGMNRLKFLEDGSAWFEGARVHPAFRGKGLASMLGKAAIETASKKGVRTQRLASNSRNQSARRQVAKMGFVEISRMSVYVPGRNSRFRHQAGVRRAERGEATRIASTIRASREFRASGGVYWDGFRALSLTPRTIERRVLEGSVYLSGDGVAISRLGSEGGERWTQVGFACGQPSDVQRLIKHVLSRKGGRESRRYVCAPQGSPLVANAREVGLVRRDSFVLYERRPPNG